ncbi:hypothetical protein P0082_08155 [Candidatus Haliotispira prima]|uniref:Uncharacterized protein n=1 Tax=Candidatus Haliotispira prima TaxID=3034016 RepID=A0ABY8MEP8_9SPIO|nr:hypothetical protein P0082_08155 [Candidatus Haliotispira prima]
MSSSYRFIRQVFVLYPVILALSVLLSPFVSLTAQTENSTDGLFRDQRSVDLNTFIDPWGSIAKWGELRNIVMGPDGQLHFYFIKGYLSLNSDLSASQDTLLSLFYSQTDRWQDNAGQYNLISPNLLLAMAPNGVISLYNSHLGAWLNGVKEVKNGRQFRLYGRQLIVFQDQKALLYPDILKDEAPKLIAEGIENAEHPQLLPNEQILYYDRESSALILTKIPEDIRSNRLPPLLIIPPKEFYRKTPRIVGAIASSKNQSPQVFYAIFHNILTFFNLSGKNIFSVPLPGQRTRAFPIGDMLFLYLPSLSKVDIYSPRPLLKNYLPPQDELLLEQAIETGKRLEDQVLLEQAKMFYEWAMKTIDQILGNEGKEALYQLRVKLGRALNRVTLLLRTDPGFYFAIQKDLQGYQSLIQSGDRFKNYRYQMTLSLAWEGIQLAKRDLSYQDLQEFPWHLFFRLSSNKSLPKEELRILLQPSVDTSKSFVDGSSTEKLQAHYFSFGFTP